MCLWIWYSPKCAENITSCLIMVWYNKIKKAVVAESSAVRSRHSNVFSSHLYSLKWRGSLTALQYVSVCVQCGLSSGGVFANQTDTWRPLFGTEICTYSTVKQAAGFSLARWARGIKANEAASYIVYKICLLAPLKFINSETDMRVVIFLSVRRKILFYFFTLRSLILAVFHSNINMSHVDSL